MLYLGVYMKDNLKSNPKPNPKHVEFMQKFLETIAPTLPADQKRVLNSIIKEAKQPKIIN